MPFLNRIEIMGNVAADVEMRFTPAGKAVTTFRVGVNHRYQKDNEWKSQTEWFSVETWEKHAEICNQRLHKGSKVFVEGRLQTRTWDTSEGQARFSLEIKNARVTFLDPFDKSNQEEESPFE
jgi:single-strand DNA-binding protein